ncbi:hypothetical protein E4U13_001087 [Claviceps humidiphila]|uniref:DUF7029 domain-containing protein n=1 Tax=Claviceps humidiphila TaxID=1294629 RepID=A0A9P7TXZ5_9HYPO|nr:hypothetical protein E4U13_001087 [Claviceps humidiphila]
MVCAAYAVAVLLGAASKVQAAQQPKPSQTLTTPTFINTVPVATLLPDVHWSYDTGHVKNVVPVQPEKGSEMYYGVSDPSKSGHFAFLKYHFTVPSVNIDHTDHVTVRYHAHDGITALFSTQEAFKHALDTWSAKDGLILIAHVPGCEGHSQGERCYFSVSDLQFNQKELSVVAQGSSKHPDEITTSGETEWGWWDAGNSNTAASGSGPVAHSPGAFSAFASPPNPGSSADHDKHASDKPFGLLECVSEPDPQTGLPTACLGTSFDDILDDKLGYSSLSAKSRQYLDDIMSDTAPRINSALSSAMLAPRASSRMRTHAIRSWSDVWNSVSNFCENAAKVVYNAFNDALTIGGKFDHGYSFKVPKPGSDRKNLRLEESPWGTAIVLTKLKDSRVPKGRTQVTKELTVYCVDCGAAGHSHLAGRAKWSPADGLSEGHIELTVSLQAALKLGIYGTASVENNIELDFLNVGLPGLTYGVVTIGPYVSLGARLGLKVGASGKILAGAEMNWQGARVVMDFTGSNDHGSSGWNRPTFQPVFEAAGEVIVSAELGLPVGLKCGLKISSWEAAIGVVDEPSVKATARGGLSTLFKPAPIENGTLTGGFHEGCAGIWTELSWRNRLWVGLVSSSDTPFLDSGDSSLLGKCIGSSAPVRRAEAIDAGNPHENQLARPLQPSPNSDHPVQQLTYTRSIMAPKLYDESSTATTLTHLLNPHESTRLLSCTNGNIYAVRNDDSTNDFCSSDWETTTQHRVVVQDAFRRPMLYYADTMSTLGVSRLRTSNADMAPKTGIAVALVPMRDEEGAQKSKRGQKKEMEFYVAMDPSGEVFYPVVCDYVDRGSVSKLFLVRDMEKGLEVLKRGDVVRSVTGGEVEKCVLLAIKAGV